MGQNSYSGCELVQTKVCELISFYELSVKSHFVVTSTSNRHELIGGGLRLEFYISLINVLN